MNDTRNIKDCYKGWMTDLIKEDIQKRTLPFSVCMVNLNQDFNFSSVVRNANAFGAQHVYYVSESKKWDKRGAVGTNHYTNVTNLASINDILALPVAYNRIAVETTAEAVSLHEFSWGGDPVLMIFGSEGMGLSKEYLDICPQKVYIPMYGSVRSLNTACASAIIMNDYAEKYNEKTGISSISRV